MIKRAFLFLFPFFLSGKLLAFQDCSDLVVFSYDRPMQLFAFLESFEKHVIGCRQIGVLCRISNKYYQKGYQIVAKRFPYVHFKVQPQTQDFKPLLLDLAFGAKGEKANFLLFAVDDIVVTDKIDLNEGVEKLKETGAYGLYYRLGKNITYCYMQKKEQKVPPLEDVGGGYFSWSMSDIGTDWGYPNTLDFTLYRKRDIQKRIERAQFTNPNELEGHWSTQKNRKAICMEKSKTVNLCINTVGDFQGRVNKGLYSSSSMNKRFLKGKKIDIQPFWQAKYISVHVNAPLRLIKREKK